MAAELSADGFDGGAFLSLVTDPPSEIVSQFASLAGKPQNASLEGYLFPDTYDFAKDATPTGILEKIIGNTDAKISGDIATAATDQNKSLFQIMTMASIIEKEVKTDADRAVVSGSFLEPHRRRPSFAERRHADLCFGRQKFLPQRRRSDAGFAV